MNKDNKNQLRLPVAITLVALGIIVMSGPFYSYPQQPFLHLSVDGPDMDNEYGITDNESI